MTMLKTLMFAAADVKKRLAGVVDFQLASALNKASLTAEVNGVNTSALTMMKVLKFVVLILLFLTLFVLLMMMEVV